MRSIWMLAAVAAVAAVTGGPAFAQALIPPSRQYKSFKPEPLDKNYGLPSLGTPAEAMPKQQTMAPKPQQEERPDAFRPMPSFAKPDEKPSDETPDFFQRPAGLASSQNSDVPSFFQDSPDDVRPKARTSNDGETPMFTTGTETGDTTTGAAASSDIPAD
jgi:hypothetical protein